MPVNKTMRITGGKLVRRRFLIPELIDKNLVRPTPDRVREAVFSMLQNDLIGSHVLDLFSGSGAHAFEALSRGAKHVDLVEKNSQIAAVIKKNIEALALGENCSLHQMDVLLAVKSLTIKADIIFVDPPYALVLDEKFFDELAGLAHENSVVVFRCFKKEPMSFGSSWELKKERVYGGTKVYILGRALTKA